MTIAKDVRCLLLCSKNHRDTRVEALSFDTREIGARKFVKTRAIGALGVFTPRLIHETRINQK